MLQYVFSGTYCLVFTWVDIFAWRSFYNSPWIHHLTCVSSMLLTSTSQCYYDRDLCQTLPFPARISDEYVHNYICVRERALQPICNFLWVQPQAACVICVMFKKRIIHYIRIPISLQIGAGVCAVLTADAIATGEANGYNCIVQLRSLPCFVETISQ